MFAHRFGRVTRALLAFSKGGFLFSSDFFDFLQMSYSTC